MQILCHLEDHSMHVLLIERKSLGKGLIKLYSFGCYLSFQDYMMLFLVLEEAKCQRDNQEQDHEVFFERELVYACFDGSGVTPNTVQQRVFQCCKV